MSRLVVDASVAGKWFLPEEHSDAAMRLLSSPRALLAPDLILAEFANLLWKRHRVGQLEGEDAVRMVEQLIRVPIEIVPSSILLPAAMRLAMAHDRTVYDCLYLALAIERDYPLVTGDRRLVNALAGGPLAGRVRWIGG